MEKNKNENLNTNEDKLIHLDVELILNSLLKDVEIIKRMSFGWEYSTPELVELLEKKIKESCNLIVQWCDRITQD